MAADAALRGLSRRLAYGWIRNQKSQAVRQIFGVPTPEGESCILDGLTVFGDVTAKDTQPGAHRIQKCQG